MKVVADNIYGRIKLLSDGFFISDRRNEEIEAYLDRGKHEAGCRNSSLTEMMIRKANDRFSVQKTTLGDRLKKFSERKEIHLKPKLGNRKDFARKFNNEQEKV